MPVADTLTQLIFKKQDAGFEELKTAVADHTYCAPLQLLLAKKVKENNAAFFQSQANIASLYFNDELWLQHLLEADKGNATLHRKETVEEKNSEAEPITSLQPDAMQTDTGEEISEFSDEQEIPGSTTEAQAEMSHFLESAAAELKKEPVGDLKISFEPLHTVDYFASQGIRFISEDKPADKFGVQLRSFTDWLKTMKKIPAGSIPVTHHDVAQEQKVIQMATHSISSENIITETMAEVWVKQGNKEKAIEVYSKLSLLNPAKSHYFASLIENLKNS